MLVRWFVRLVGGTVVAFAVLATVFLVGMRTKTPLSWTEFAGSTGP